MPTYNHDLTRTGLFNRNQVGGTLILFIPLNIALLIAVLFGDGTTIADSESPMLTGRLQARRFLVGILLSFALLATGGTLILTQSRSALTGLVAALLLLLSSSRRWALITFIVLIILVLTGVWWVGPAEVGQAVLDVADAESSKSSLSFAGRQEVWSRAVYMLQDFPYTGVGLGMFDQVAHVLYPFFLIGPDVTVVHAHNVYLQVGVDLGVPGLVAYIALITTFCGVAWRASRHASTLVMRAVALGLLGGVVAYHIYGLTDAMTLGAKPGVALWTMLGLAVVLYSNMVTSTTSIETTR